MIIHILIICGLLRSTIGFKIYFPFLKIDEDVNTTTEPYLKVANSTPTTIGINGTTTVHTKSKLNVKHEFEYEYTTSAEYFKNASQKVGDPGYCATQKPITCKPATGTITTTTMTSSIPALAESAGNNNVTSASGLEIDETKKAKPSHFPTNEEIITRFVSMPKEQDTVTLTKIQIKTYTRIQTVYPSCLKVGEEISGYCELTLRTIHPSQVPEDVNVRIQTDYDVPESQVLSSEGNNHESQAESSNQEPIEFTHLQFRIEQGFSPTISEYDYDFEIIPEGDAKNGNKSPTPQLQNVPSTGSIRRTESISYNMLQSQLQMPQFKYVTELIPSTTLRVSTNTQTTATIIAKQCIPSNINLPLCTDTPRKPFYST